MPVRLFISDIDGCIAEPYTPYRLDAVRTIAALADAAERSPSSSRPRFALCSGRPYPYVEALTQALGLRAPVLFESGGGMFDPVSARVTWNPAFTPAVAEQIETVRHWLIEEVLPGTAMMYDYGKRTQAGIIGPDAAEVARAAERVLGHVADRFPDLVAFRTSVSIDVLAAGITKREAMAWLADEVGVTTAEMAYIGDTHGDLGALGAVGYAFAPANADADVRAAVDVVTRGAVADGVVEAYRWCLRHNGVTAEVAGDEAAVRSGGSR